jgi:RNA polymerase sigma-70 factor (ECF subfamily)
MWPDSMETEALLQRARRQDMAAINRLFERHRDALRDMIALRLERAIRRRVDASDVAQVVLLDASRRLKEYLEEPSLPFHLWLRQIAHDRLIDEYRRHKGSQRRTVDREQSLRPADYLERSALDLAAAIRDPELTPAAAAIRHEIELRFHAALDELSEDDREMLLMRHSEQLSNSDVARALGVTDAAAGMRYLRALRRLRAVLGETPSRSGSS